jgi:hypothetical protein
MCALSNQKAGEVIPIEVKAEENLKSKSLKVFAEKTGTDSAVRISMNPYREKSWMYNLPLYAVNGL